MPNDGPIRFGVFEVDLAARELRRRGVRVRLQEQPFRVLEALLESPGEVVTREELRQRLWAKDEFVEFDASLNTAVQRIRQALGDSAENPRFVETVPRVGYKFIAAVQPPPSPPPIRLWVAAIAAIAVAVGVWIWLQPGPRHIERIPRQLTDDTGMTAWPDITPDGRLVVYSSDRDGGPDLDLWIHNIALDEATQLTDEPGDEIQPRFSPDGARIVYYSDTRRAIFVVPVVSGAKPRLIAANARTARFSLDGQRLAYAQSSADRGYAARLVLANADGSDPQLVEHGLLYLGVGTLWLPDGRLLTGGNPGRVMREGDWYLLSPEADDITATGAKLIDEGLSAGRAPPFAPQAWLAPEGAAIVSVRNGDSIELRKVPISLEHSKVTGPSERLTSAGSLGYDVGASRGGHVVYSSVEQNIDLWRLPLAQGGGAAAGQPQRLTDRLGAEYQPVLSAHGSRIAYLSSASSRNGRRAWVHTGSVVPFRHERLFSDEDSYTTIALASDGEEILYGVRVGSKQEIRSASLREGTPRTVCTDCGRLLSWSPGRHLVLHSGLAPESQIVALDTRTGAHHVIATDSRYDFHDPRISPDGRWLSFHQWRAGVHYRTVSVVRFDISRTATEDDWIDITADSENSFRAEWSPDGKWIYYFSQQGGPYAIWAQRFDTSAGAPAGEPKLVYEGRAGLPTFQSDFSSGAGLPRLAVGPDFLVFDAVERRGNIWLLEPNNAE